MTPMTEIGPMGQRLAEVIVQKVVASVRDYPTPSDGEREAIVREVARQLLAGVDDDD